MNKVSKINLSNLKKCNQVWEKMPKNEKGRLCLMCNNIIIDFRNMTDSEVAETHLFSTQKICGLYKKEQLKRPNRVAKKNKLNHWNSFYAWLFGFLSFTSTAQENAESIKTEQTEPKFDSINYQVNKKNENNSVLVRDSILITGKLTDKNDTPLPFTNVVVKGTKIGTTSNIDGYYSLNLSKVLESFRELTLVCSFVGYKTTELVIDTELLKDEKNRVIDIQLADGEITSFYVVEKVPLHKKILCKMKRVFIEKNPNKE